MRVAPPRFWVWPAGYNCGKHPHAGHNFQSYDCTDGSRISIYRCFECDKLLQVKISKRRSPVSCIRYPEMTAWEKVGFVLLIMAILAACAWACSGCSIETPRVRATLLYSHTQTVAANGATMTHDGPDVDSVASIGGVVATGLTGNPWPATAAAAPRATEAFCKTPAVAVDNLTTQPVKGN